MRVATLILTVLAAASTVTFAAPVPAPVSTPVAAPVGISIPLPGADSVSIPPPVQDLHTRSEWPPVPTLPPVLHARSFWSSIKKAASGAAKWVGNAANKVKNVFGAASNVYNSASNAYKSVSNAYNQVAPLVKAIHKRDDEFDEQLHRRDELEFEEELHRRDEMEFKEQLHRRDVENTQSEDAPAAPARRMRKVSGGARHARHHHD